MDTEYYRNFLAIVEAGSMTVAADFLHITQPTLSKQLRILEKMYGTELLVLKRGRRQMYLTEAGEALYTRAKHICLLEDMAMAEVERTLHKVEGPLRFSIAQGRTERFINQVLLGFRQTYPEVYFELYEGIVTTQQEQLLSGVTDLGLCSTEITEPDLFEVLFTRNEEMILVGTEACPGFPAKKEVEPEEIRGLPLAISGGLAGMLNKEIDPLEKYFNIVSISTTKGSALDWAKTGLAAALVPAEPTEFQQEGYRTVRLRHPLKLYKSIIRAVQRPLPYVAKVFLSYYRQVHPDAVCNEAALEKLIDE